MFPNVFISLIVLLHHGGVVIISPVNHGCTSVQYSTVQCGGTKGSQVTGQLQPGRAAVLQVAAHHLASDCYPPPPEQVIAEPVWSQPLPPQHQHVAQDNIDHDSDITSGL